MKLLRVIFLWCYALHLRWVCVNNMENKRNFLVLMATSIYLKRGFILQKCVMKHFITHRYKSTDEVHKMKVYNGENVSVRLFHFRNY